MRNLDAFGVSEKVLLATELLADRCGRYQLAVCAGEPAGRPGPARMAFQQVERLQRCRSASCADDQTYPRS